MRIIYAKSKWEVWNQDTEKFLQRVREDGYEATEFYINEASESSEELAELHEKYNLKIITQFLTEGRDYHDHLKSIDRLSQAALDCNPILVNVHPGKDYFSFEENCKILKKLCELSEETGIPFTAETHRGRATYSLIETCKYIDKLPELSITADLSHWMVVHESNLLDQKEALQSVIDHSLHIHARVGYEEGPQVTDPRAPEWNRHLDNHLQLWQKIIDNLSSKGSEYVTITPEFGPPNYLHTLPFSNKPVRDAWELNNAMKQILEDRLKIE